MIVNQLRFSYRNMVRNKTFAAINISGLVISLTAVILMSLYIENELSFDKFNRHSDHIFRVVDDKQTEALLQHTAATAAPVAPALLNDFPEIKYAARLIGTEGLMKYHDRLFEERKIYIADASFFKIFDSRWLSGNENTALTEPASIVLTEKMAVKYFGRSNPLNEVMLFDGKPVKVTGIIQDIPAPSHLQFDFLLSMATAEAKDSGYDWMFVNWYSNNFYTYILLDENHDPKLLIDKFSSFASRHHANTKTTKHHYNLEKLTDIYLHSDRESQAGKTGSAANLYVFSVIAAFILLIACINFINLSTARAGERAKEIAIRKVNGVTVNQLRAQFLLESFLTTAIALTMALVAAFMLIPSFNQFAGTEIVFSWNTPVHVIALLGLLVIVGLFSGAYPAFMLSRINAIKALKGKISTSVSSIAIRKALVVIQFAISMILIVGSIVVYKQLNFMQTHELGFSPAQTLVINFEGDRRVQQNYTFIKSQIGKIAGVQSVSASSGVPGTIGGSTWSMDFAKKTGDTIHTELPIVLTDFNFMKQYNIPMLAGRALSEDFAADTVESMIINETALRKLGFNNAEEAIGLKVSMYPRDARVVGVYKDFHFTSLQKPIEPLAIRVLSDKFRLFSIQVSTSDLKKTLVDLDALWKNIVPYRPLEYSFLNDTFNQQYRSEIKFGQLISVFTAIAISIACFGLFGLALFSIRQRTKEIGIRKVIGASVVQITALLTKEFITLVLLAMVIAFPIAFFVMTKWIQAFAYRITIGWWIFVWSGFIAVLIAVVTISHQAIKAAMINPVKSLKNE